MGVRKKVLREKDLRVWTLDTEFASLGGEMGLAIKNRNTQFQTRAYRGSDEADSTCTIQSLRVPVL